jgi:hypothetical protein
MTKQDAIKVARTMLEDIAGEDGVTQIQVTIYERKHHFNIAGTDANLAEWVDGSSVDRERV